MSTLDFRRALTLTAMMAGALAAGCHDTLTPIVGVSAPRPPEKTIRTVDASDPEPSPVPGDFHATMSKVRDRFLSQGHGQRFDAVIWANAAAAAHWDAPGDMGEGAMLVEEAILKESGGDETGGLLVMERRGDAWRFVGVTVAGDVVSDARVGTCQTCHAEASGGVFKETQPKR